MNLILNIITSETSLTSALIIILGLILRFILTFCKQLWVTTYHHTMTFMILPFSTYTITKLISGNIALSLGMVGALSIVRFRNPVKNTFELVMFFALITLGISGTVGYIYTISYFFILSSIIILSYLIEKFYQKRNKRLFSFSFNEGEKMSTLTIYTKKVDSKLSNDPLLISKFEDFEENKNIYRFASKEIEKLNYISDKTKKENLSNIISIEYAQN